MSIPVCTLSPICSSDILTDFPFSRETLATDGKQALRDGALHVQHLKYPFLSSQTPQGHPHVVQRALFNFTENWFPHSHPQAWQSPNFFGSYHVT